MIFFPFFARFFCSFFGTTLFQILFLFLDLVRSFAVFFCRRGVRRRGVCRRGGGGGHRRGARLHRRRGGRGGGRRRGVHRSIGEEEGETMRGWEERREEELTG